MTDFSVSERTYQMRPGYLTVHHDQLMVYGVLGSGVFVGLFDQRNQYSGCCYFQFPRSPGRKSTSRFGEQAIRYLVTLMQQGGSHPRDLRAHVIGGGIKRGNTFGERNIHAAMEVLHELNVPIDTTDTGGMMGRKFVYNTATGEHMVMKVHNIRSQDWYPYN